jgi:hypothetical protein
MEDGADGGMEAFATPAGVEAFASLCLENNEQDWLHEAKVIIGGRRKKRNFDTVRTNKKEILI